MIKLLMVFPLTCLLVFCIYKMFEFMTTRQRMKALKVIGGSIAVGFVALVVLSVIVVLF